MVIFDTHLKSIESIMSKFYILTKHDKAKRQFVFEQ